MSDTDDTDVLLLIPPNFFRVYTSDSDESFVYSARTVIKNDHSVKSHVLNNLMTQVRSIETRLDSLESSSIVDFNSAEKSSSSISTYFGNEGIIRQTSVNNVYPSTPHTKHNLNLSADDTINHTFPKRKKKSTRRIRSNLSSSNSYRSRLSVNSALPSQLRKSQFLSSNEDCNGTYFTNKNCRNVQGMKLSNFGLKTRSLITMSEANDTSTIVSDKYDDAPMLSEIDQFLNRVELFERSIHSSFEQSDVQGTSASKQFPSEHGKLVDHEQLDVQYLPKSYLHKYIYLTEDCTKNEASTEPINKRNELKLDPDKSPSSNHIAAKYTVTKLQENGKGKSPTVRRLQFPETISLSSNTSTPNDKNFIDHKIYAPGSPIKSVIQEKAEILINKHQKMMNLSDDNMKKLNAINYKLQEKKDCNFFKDSPLKKGELDSTCSSYPISLTPQKDSNSQDQTFDSLAKYPTSNALGVNLMSLADLWNSRANINDDNLITKQRFEEERLKRQHCENIIQQLQKKHLEQQQKIAIAISIDKAKDEAINKLKNAWLRLSSNLTEMDSKHKSIMERMTSEVKIIRLESQQHFEKAEHYEKELTKALDLAHDYQDKCKSITQSSKLAIESAHEECKKYVDQLSEKDNIITELKDSHSSVVKLNKQFTDCVDKLEQCMEKEKNKNKSLNVEVDSLKTSQEQMQNEVVLLKQNRDNLKMKLDEEKERNMSLAQSSSEAKSRMKTLEDELHLLKRQADSQKLELKSFYQKQLEDAVLCKLKEFQLQLDEAEKIMASDLREKQKSIAEAFAKQIQLLESEHKKERAKLEENQRDEVKLYRLQLAQSSQKIVHLEDKLQTYRNKRGQIATQLHQVMESQWQQALRILTAGVNTPSGSSTMHSIVGKDFTLADNTDSRQSQNFLRPINFNEIDNRVLTGFRTQSEPYLKSNVNESDQQLSYIAMQTNHQRLEREDFVTPVRSKQENEIVLSDNDIQKYIKLLLSKQPNEVDSDNPQTDTTDKTDRYSPDSNYAELDQRERPTSDKIDDRRSTSKNRESQNHNSLKPPWK